MKLVTCNTIKGTFTAKKLTQVEFMSLMARGQKESRTRGGSRGVGDEEITKSSQPKTTVLDIRTFKVV